jgi:hypothetical protein
VEAEGRTRTLGRVRDRLGEERFRRFWEEGEGMSLGETLVYAQGEPELP